MNKETGREVEIEALENYINQISAYVRETMAAEPEMKSMKKVYLEANLLGLKSSLKLLEEKVKKLREAAHD